LTGIEQVGFARARRRAANVHPADGGRLGEHDRASGRSGVEREMPDLDARHGRQAGRATL
jgi:hypothetical protein